MPDEPFSRWQHQAIAQLSVALALISGLALSSLALGMTLLLNPTFLPIGFAKLSFAFSFPLLLITTLLCCCAVVSRALDYRLTARKARRATSPHAKRALTIFWLGPDAYGRLSWFLFWSSLVTFLLGAGLLISTVALVYADRFYL